MAVVAVVLAGVVTVMPGHAQVNAPDAVDIIGGGEVAPGAIPWQVWYEFTVQGESYSCGGSLIHPEWVLTAAHCLQDATGREVVLGAHDFDAEQEPGRQIVAVDRTVVHPVYDDATTDNATASRVKAVLDLADFDGQSGALEFVAETDEIDASSLLLDNVVLSRDVSGGDPVGQGRSFLPPIAVP